jgi:hypothetical protein
MKVDINIQEFEIIKISIDLYKVFLVDSIKCILIDEKICL